jgi:RimJ/RimL family protein N-acetyltransferase
MIFVRHTNIYKIYEYSRHLKNLTDADKYSRFGFSVSDSTIDQLILSMCYDPKNHELWYAEINDQRIGWGHMANNQDGTWELAVSVDNDFQRQGVGNKLINEMLAFAKFHYIPEVYLHCNEGNQVIQHLAAKNKLKTKLRDNGERTVSLEIPNPTMLEVTDQRLKEHAKIVQEIGNLQKRLAKLYLPL